MILDPLTRFLLAITVIVLVCHTLGAILARVGQPRVIGEILGGLLLGPSALGYLWPGARDALFPAGVVGSIDFAAQLGLVVFMFLLGCELRFNQLRANRSAVSTVVLAAMGLPFLGGLGVAAVGRPLIAGSAGGPTLYLLFMGLALAITALPVMARVLVDLGMDKGLVGPLALASAACGDGLMWAALTVLLSAAGLHGVAPAVTVAMAVGLLLATVLVIRPVLARVIRGVEASSRGEQLLVPVLIGGAIGYATVTQLIGLHLVIGAFLFGMAVPRGSAVVERISRQMQGFTITILLPLFFAGIGLKISVGLLGTSPWAWTFFAFVLLVATAGKIAGGAGGARLAGLSGPDALRVGALMNCRGVTELVVASIGWQHHLINALGMTILTLVALITTAATAPLLTAIGRPRTARRRLPASRPQPAGARGLALTTTPALAKIGEQ
jgi:Kef-type K+ transport system membrane component KefB